jgi:predicted RNase H-like nuclease (RuvC/YqgF family)
MAPPPPTYESDSSVFSDEPIAPHRLVELLHNQTEEFNEKVEDIKEVFVKGIEISGKCMVSLNESIKDKMEEYTEDIKDDIDILTNLVVDGTDKLSGLLDVKMERVTMNVSSLYNAICGSRDEHSLDTKHTTKIDEHAKEIKSLKRKLDENNELLNQIIKRLGHITL